MYIYILYIYIYIYQSTWHILQLALYDKHAFLLGSCLGKWRLNRLPFIRINRLWQNHCESGVLPTYTPQKRKTWKTWKWMVGSWKTNLSIWAFFGIFQGLLLSVLGIFYGIFCILHDWVNLSHPNNHPPETALALFFGQKLAIKVSWLYKACYETPYFLRGYLRKGRGFPVDQLTQVKTQEVFVNHDSTTRRGPPNYYKSLYPKLYPFTTMVKQALLGL